MYGHFGFPLIILYLPYIYMGMTSLVHTRDNEEIQLALILESLF